MAASVGIVGGTGPLGRGLAIRWSLAGVEVTIGSRDPQRAREAVDKVLAKVGDGAVPVRTGTNRDAAVGDVVLLAIPFAALDGIAADLAEALEGRIVVSVINSMAFDERGPYPEYPEEGSAAVACARRLPAARVVGAFNTVSSRQLARIDEALDEDVPIFGDDDDAVAVVADLANRVDGLRGVPAGPLRLSGPLEGMTAVLIWLNRRHGVQAGLRFSHLPL